MTWCTLKLPGTFKVFCAPSSTIWKCVRKRLNDCLVYSVSVHKIMYFKVRNLHIVCLYSMAACGLKYRLSCHCKRSMWNLTLRLWDMKFTLRPIQMLTEKRFRNAVFFFLTENTTFQKLVGFSCGKSGPLIRWVHWNELFWVTGPVLCEVQTVQELAIVFLLTRLHILC